MLNGPTRRIAAGFADAVEVNETVSTRFRWLPEEDRLGC